MSRPASDAREVCITADDYGLASPINEAIEELAAQGAITTVSVMVHRDAQLAGLDRLRRSEVALGLHLVLTGGRPLTGWPGGDLPGGYPSLFAQLATRKAIRRAVRAEVEAQLDRFGELVASPGFVNSHQHVHLHPQVWPPVAELLAHHGVRWVRSARDQPLRPSRGGLLAAASRVSWWTRPLAGGRTLSPIGAFNARRSGEAGLEEALSVIARSAFPAGTLPEVVAHPARDDRRYGNAPIRRRPEYEWLRSSALPEALARYGLAAVRSWEPDA